MSDQPEALRLADLWEKHSHGYARTPEARTAALLRRQHAEIASLKAERDALRAELANIGDLKKRQFITRESDLSEWADWAQNRARYAAREEKRDE